MTYEQIWHLTWCFSRATGFHPFCLLIPFKLVLKAMVTFSSTTSSCNFLQAKWNRVFHYLRFDRYFMDSRVGFILKKRRFISVSPICLPLAYIVTFVTFVTSWQMTVNSPFLQNEIGKKSDLYSRSIKAESHLVFLLLLLLRLSKKA